MEFGIFDHLDRSPSSLADYYEERLAIVELFDRAGFHAYHLAEHHATPLGMAPSPSVFLAAVAQRTKRLRFGPMIFALPLYHPLRMIEEICMLDQMSGGRLDVGFGRGASPIELELFGTKPSEARDIYDESLATTSFTLVMLGIAGAMAMMLGLIGIYGVISYAVSQRKREIGIRIALGAEPAALQWLFVRYGLALAGTGAVIGLATAAGTTRLMKSVLFGISPVDPLTYTAVPLVLLAATVLACYLPARRAAAVDPGETLRAE